MAKKPDDIVKVLYGSETYYKNCPGWCRYHHTHLTANQIKTKNCLGKQCKCLDKIEHKFWEQRDKKKQKKKENREKGGICDTNSKRSR